MNELDPNINVNNVLSSIGWEYMRTHPYTLKDGGMEFASKQKGFQMVNPTDEWFPGTIFIFFFFFIIQLQ